MIDDSMPDLFVEDDLSFIDAMLDKYGHDDSVLDVSELDGFLTAIISGPEFIPTSQWLPALWGGREFEPTWESDDEMQRFLALVIQHMNNNAGELMEAPWEYGPLFIEREYIGKKELIAAEWCTGYMRGIDLAGGWPAMPDEQSRQLAAIALHGTEKGIEMLSNMSFEEQQASVEEIAPAVRGLHAYWLAQRSQTPHGDFMRATPKVGRNDPCPCGSGKKYKKCCLH